ncbi:MAG: RluA family pseudouridine synthase [Anaerolineae bacterium]
MKGKHEPELLHLDLDMLVVSKPAGLPTVPDGYEADQPYLAGLLEPTFGRVWVVHRLDRDTSGVVVLARNADAHKAISAQFQEHRVVKIYHALVMGHPTWQERSVSAPLRVDADRQHRTIIDLEAGKPSTTYFRVLEKFQSPLMRVSLLEATPKQGRTHQIRVHLCALGLPVAADPLYGNGAPLMLSAIKRQYQPSENGERPLIGRLALHALSITLTHPTSGQTYTFEAPYPKDFSAALKQLRKHAARQTQPISLTSGDIRPTWQKGSAR